MNYTNETNPLLQRLRGHMGRLIAEGATVVVEQASERPLAHVPYMELLAQVELMSDGDHNLQVTAKPSLAPRGRNLIRELPASYFAEAQGELSHRRAAMSLTLATLGMVNALILSTGKR